MGNCSNITNSQTVALTAGTLTSGFCHSSLQTTFEEFVGKTTGSLSGKMAAFTAGDDTPAADDQDKLWFKQDPSDCNAPFGWFFYNASVTPPAWEPVQATDPSPIGSIVMYGGAASPNANWLLCDGGSFNVTTYATLNTILGTSYGVAGTLPDLRSRTPVGYGQGSGLTNRALNDTGGAEGVTLTVAESGLPSHSHTQRGGGFNGSVGIEPGNTLVTDLGETGTTGGTDASQAHENMPPFITVNFIIRGL
jgi:microcystin-dependent protein